MGFWDYQSDEQLKHDNEIYPKDRKDREIMQKGNVRVTAYKRGEWQSTVLEGQDFLTLDGSEDSSEIRGRVVTDELPAWRAERPLSIRIPGTSVYADVK